MRPNSGLFLNGAIDAFVAAMVDVMVPKNLAIYRVVISGFTGFMAYPILTIVQSHGVEYVKKRFWVK